MGLTWSNSNNEGAQIGVGGDGENKGNIGGGQPPQPQQVDYSASQIRSLMARGLKPDMALQPFQMDRLEVQALQTCEFTPTLSYTMVVCVVGRMIHSQYNQQNHVAQ
jgi:hypothetical protein